MPKVGQTKSTAAPKKIPAKKPIKSTPKPKKKTAADLLVVTPETPCGFCGRTEAEHVEVDYADDGSCQFLGTEGIKPVPTPVLTAEKIDFLFLGQAAALADIAEANGLDVEGICATPARLRAIGLPESPLHSMRRLAHKIQRDRIDGMLFRTGGHSTAHPMLPTSTPALREASKHCKTEAEAEKILASPRPEQKAKAVAAKANGVISLPGKARQTIFGQPATRVVMALGKEKYTTAQAEAVLAHFGVTSTPASIQTFLRAGANGQRGEPAKLSQDQRKQVEQILGL